MNFNIGDKVIYRMRYEPTILRGTVIGQIGLGSPVTVRWDVPFQRGRHKVYVTNMGEEVLERTRALQPIKYLKRFNMCL